MVGNSVWVFGSGTKNGIGGAISEELRSEKFDVKDFDVSGNRNFIRCDVTDEESVAKIFRDNPPPSSIVYSAGYNISGSILEYSKDDFAKTLAVNLTGVFLVSKYFVKSTLKQPGPKFFISIGSDSANTPHINSFAYCSSKGGLQMLTKCLARDLAKDGYRYMEIQPSLVEGTNMDIKIDKIAAGLQGLTVEQIRERRLMNVPIGRYASPKELAKWVPFLIRYGEYANGSCIRVTGGVK